VATSGSCAKPGSGNWRGTCLAASAALIAVGGLALKFCDGESELMVTLRPKGGAPALVRGARTASGPVGSIETGGAVFESGTDVGREGNTDGDAGDEGAGAPGGPVDPKGVIEFRCRLSWVTLGDNRLSSLLLCTDDGIGKERGKEVWLALAGGLSEMRILMLTSWERNIRRIGSLQSSISDPVGETVGDADIVGDELLRLESDVREALDRGGSSKHHRLGAF